MADDRRIVYTVSVNPQEGLLDENSNVHWIPDSDVKVSVGGGNSIDIHPTQASAWYVSQDNIDTTGDYLTSDGDSTVIEFVYIKNNSDGTDNILVSFDKHLGGSATYPIKILPGEAFACRLNSIIGDKIHIKSSANTLDVEYLAAKAE